MEIGEKVYLIYIGMSKESIEYFRDGKNFKSQLIKDKIESDFCKKNVTKLIRITYYEYKNIQKILENEI